MATPEQTIVLLPDAGPLITLAYADALDLLFRPSWSVALVDMVLHEVTRNQTPTSDKLARWAQANKLPVLPTSIHAHHQHNLATLAWPPRKSNLGELAIQECMGHFAVAAPPQQAVFLFEDHKIARASFIVPGNCRKVSTRAFLLFLEQKGWLASAADIELKAIRAGRAFSSLRFPP